MAFLILSACQDWDAKENLDFYFEKSPSSKKMSTETLMKEFNHVVIEKSDFQHATKLKILDCIDKDSLYRSYIII